MATRKLSEGVFGAKLVDYFSANANGIPVEADYLGNVSRNEDTYRITFDDGTVSDWKITFEDGPTLSLEIESAELFNQVL